MSIKTPTYYSSSQICQLCYQQTKQLQVKKTCGHKICDQCIIIKTKYQSDCPCCWYTNIQKYVNANRICSVCCRDIKSNDQPYPCSERHLQCSDCIKEGCILCQFRQLKASNEKSYRDPSPHSQRILYHCEIWQKKFEETKHLLIEHDKESQLVSGSLLSKTPSSSTKSDEPGDCMICLERLGSSYKRLSECDHCFHQSCIDKWFQSSGKQSCPTCGHIYGISKGPQPENGRMTINYLPKPLPGFEKIHYGHKENPTIEIIYSFPSGTQGPLNPNPGKPFTGTTRKAYLPNNKEGKEILKLLQKAFDDGHIFTIGRSTSTGQDNVVTWNDIHHKTSMYGGPESFGYPDPTYLYRVRQELGDKGYK